MRIICVSLCFLTFLGELKTIVKVSCIRFTEIGTSHTLFVMRTRDFTSILYLSQNHLSSKFSGVPKNPMNKNQNVLPTIHVMLFYQAKLAQSAIYIVKNFAYYLTCRENQSKQR